jgi:hypothetical protein
MAKTKNAKAVAGYKVPKRPCRPSLRFCWHDLMLRAIPRRGGLWGCAPSRMAERPIRRPLRGTSRAILSSWVGYDVRGGLVETEVFEMNQLHPRAWAPVGLPGRFP